LGRQTLTSNYILVDKDAVRTHNMRLAAMLAEGKEIGFCESIN